MNFYIPDLHGKNEDSSLFDEDHYFWGMKNVVNLPCDETINNLNRLIDNLDKWLVPTPTQNTSMAGTLMDTETDDANDDELNTGENMDMEPTVMNTETDDANDDELNTGENMDMEPTVMNTETDDANDDESNNATQNTKINPEHYMGNELPINIPVVENVPDNHNDDSPATAENHHIDTDRRGRECENIFRRFWSYHRRRTKRNYQRQQKMFISFLFLSVTIKEVFIGCVSPLKFITAKLTSEWLVNHDMEVKFRYFLQSDRGWIPPPPPL